MPTDDNPNGPLKIYINSTIVPGEYAFGFYVTPPLTTPVKNEMSLILKDRYGKVKDAAVGLTAPRVQDKLQGLVARQLQWTSTRPGRASTITIGFSALQTLPDEIIAPIQQVGEILITMPTGFTHLVDLASDFTLTNEDMPRRSPQWLSYMSKDTLRVSLNLNKSGSWTTLKTGEYEFRFPVLVPAVQPVFNVWHLTLCRPSYPNGCTRLKDPAALLTFPFPGFAFSSVNEIGGTGAAPARPCPGRLLGVAFFVVAIFLPAFQ